MPYKKHVNHHPYGDTTTEEVVYECDENCTPTCFEQECKDAAKCPVCGQIYCIKQDDGCPNKCEDKLIPTINPGCKDCNKMCANRFSDSIEYAKTCCWYDSERTDFGEDDYGDYEDDYRADTSEEDTNNEQ